MSSSSERTWSSTSRGSKRPRDEHQSEPRIKITIQDQEGQKSKYQVAAGAPLKHLFREHCRDTNLDYRIMRFAHNGNHINNQRSAAQLGIEDGEVILSLAQMSGG